MWDNATITMLLEGTRDTLYMTLVSTFFGYVLGLPLGILLAVTDKEGIHPNAAVYKVLDVIGVFNNLIADARKHPLTTRRYMWKFPY